MLARTQATQPRFHGVLIAAILLLFAAAAIADPHRDPGPDLSVSVHGADLALAGEDFIYRLKVANLGTAGAFDVYLYATFNSSYDWGLAATFTCDQRECSE